MWDPLSPWPQGSFQTPVPIPESAPGDGPLLCVSINADWMGYLIGAAKQLMIPSTWGDMRDPLVIAAQTAANDLIALLAEAAPCGVSSVSGTYVGTCLAADLAVAASTMTDVLSITVDPGEYTLMARLCFWSSGGGANAAAYLWDGTSYLAATSSNTIGDTYQESYDLSVRVTPAVTTTYTVRVYMVAKSGTVFAEVQYAPDAGHVVSCLEAIPLGVSGPTGPDGPPGPATQVRFTAACGLEYSTDSGVTWLAVPGWLTNAPTCFAGFHGATIPISLIDPGAPPSIPGVAFEQASCNIAAYLAQDVLRGALNQAQHSAGLTQTALEFGGALLALIPGVDVAIVGYYAASAALYSAVIGGTLSDYTAAASDDTLWAAMTCAIYGVIREDGEVTAANFAAVASAISAVTYTHAEVPPAAADFFTGLGIEGVRAAQAAGALNVADCSGCGSSGAWCTWWEPGQRDLCNGDWTGFQTSGPTGISTCSSGVFQPVTGSGEWAIGVRLQLPHPRTLTAVRQDYSGSFGDPRHLALYDSAGTLLYSDATGNWLASNGSGPIANVSRVDISCGGGDSPVTLGSIKVGGPDFGSPWDDDNGVCD